MDHMVGSIERLILFAIDGLMADVFQNLLQAGDLPHISRLFAGKKTSASLHLNAVSTLPSITFCSHTSIFTGLSPCQHGILGNQFFDRFGINSGVIPSFYAFDIGGTYEIDDAVNVFLGKGLINKLIPGDRPTIYEMARKAGLSSLVAHNMVSRGASVWLKPSISDVARFTSGKGPVKITAQDFDRKMVNRVLRYLSKKDCPAVMTLYFLGLDHESHHHGRQVQGDYLKSVIDPQIGRVLDRLEEMGALNHTAVVFVSDHGQVDVVADDRHSLRLSFPFDREMAHFFDAIGLDVHSYPGEDPNCDAVVACNGGMAYVYLRHRSGSWKEAPRYFEDVLPVAQAFWEANLTGQYSPEIQNALAAILVRNTRDEGVYSSFQVYHPGELEPFGDFLARNPEIARLEAVHRLSELTCPLSGEILLLSNYREGYYFGSPVFATHGGFHPDESRCVFSITVLDDGQSHQVEFENAIRQYLDKRLMERERSYISVADVTPVISRIMGWMADEPG